MSEAEIKDRDGFLRFLRMLRSESESNLGSFTNQTLPAYLKGIAMTLEDFEKIGKPSFRGASADVPSWDLLAELLYSAMHYDDEERRHNKAFDPTLRSAPQDSGESTVD
jgi:hypothetical protein